MLSTILITGATSGFGLATARLFNQQGWKTIITGRRKEKLEELAKELKAAPCLPLCFDVRSSEECQKALQSLPNEFKQVDVLMNNAGLAMGLEPAHRASEADWMQMIDTNIKGLVFMTRLLLPQMIERNSGHIVNIGSIAGSWPYPGGNVYGATKAFVKQFSLNLKTDLIGTNVKVTDIQPGLAETEFSIVRFKGDKAKADKVYERTTPLVGQDIAESVWWVVNRPPHVNINSIEIMPTCQAWNGFQIDRK